jgi:hypothetical protein
MKLNEKIFSKTQNIPSFELFIAIHKYEVRMNSNDNLWNYHEISNLPYTYRPSPSKNLEKSY